MDQHQLKVFARRRDYNRDISLLFRTKEHVVKPVVFEPHKDGDLIDPSICLGMPAAQMLMNELWTCGLRPSEGVSSTGQIEAMQSHLDDFRKIVFKRLDIGGD